MNQYDAYKSVVADCWRMNQISEMELAECEAMAKRARHLMSEKRIGEAQRVAHTVSLMSRNIATRLEVAMSSRSVASRIMSPEAGDKAVSVGGQT